ncbi:M15 family metallopeptidase [Pseudokineococcus basanitobsidens]|uniref:M15 family metallopeptidase n=1 Tax=Pseudokineococcus basanitobsidens TaxID=1926649 RepID=A0ABU8RLF3_9ACTN
MEGISGITARMASLQSQVAALSPGGLVTASSVSSASTSGSPAGASGAGTSSAFSDVLAQQLGGAATTTASTTGAPDPLAALLGGTAAPAGLPATSPPVTGTPATGTTAEPAYTTTTTTSLSADGLAQLLASLAGDRSAPATAAAATTGAAAVRGVAAPTPASAPVAAPVPGAGTVDAKGVPLDLKAYGNGKVPEKQLVEIGGAGSGERLWAPAAAAFDRMSAAARADGVRLGVNDSYRSYTDQVDMAARKGLRSQGGLAAAPGTSSHGWGMAVDLQLDGRAQSWMRDNAGRYGFAETVPGEPWHWGFRPRPV